jgi:hypothetical protein
MERSIEQEGDEGGISYHEYLRRRTKTQIEETGVVNMGLVHMMVFAGMDAVKVEREVREELLREAA